MVIKVGQGCPSNSILPIHLHREKGVQWGFINDLQVFRKSKFENFKVDQM